MFILFNIAMMPYYILMAAAIIPPVVLMIYMYNNDRYEREPAYMVWRTIGAGIMAALAAMVLEYVFEAVFFNSSVQPSTDVSIHEAIMVGLVEEGCKLFFLYRATWKSPEFNYRYDGILYAEKLSKAGVKVLLNETKGTMHGFDIVQKAEATKAALAARIEYMKNVFYSNNKG